MIILVSEKKQETIEQAQSKQCAVGIDLQLIDDLSVADRKIDLKKFEV